MLMIKAVDNVQIIPVIAIFYFTSVAHRQRKTLLIVNEFCRLPYRQVLLN